MPSDPVSQSHLSNLLVAGTRVVLRFRLAGSGLEPGGPTLTDAVGEVASVSDEAVVVTTRRGPVTVPRASIVLAKRVPPAPARKRQRAAVDDAESIGIDTLQVLMTAGMPPLVSTYVGDWLVRSAEGYTGRANSSLPVGDPGIPLDHAVDRVAAWYADHDQPALIQLPHPENVAPSATPLGTVLAQRGWRFFLRTLVMTRTTTARRAVAPGVRVETSPSAPTDDWWAAASPRALDHRETLARILGLVPESAYLTAYIGDRPVGHARLAFHGGWSGIFDVHTDPGARRTGVARAIMATAAGVAADRRIPMQYLQVAADNVAAVGLYESLGWQVHHEYHYATPAAE